MQDYHRHHHLLISTADSLLRGVLGAAQVQKSFKWTVIGSFLKHSNAGLWC